MQGVIRVASIAYLIFITLLLLTGDPARLIGLNGRFFPLLRVLMPWAHLLSFLTLSILVLSTRWPAPRWIVVLLLVVYAAAIELAQSLVPQRTVEWQDWLMNMAGIAVATVLCWAGASLAGAIALRRRRRCQAVPANEWDIMHRAMNRPGARAQSWWG